MKDELITKTLEQYIEGHKDNYFIIGGNAVNYVLSTYGIEFRVTDDFDIVLVTQICDDMFINDLNKLIRDGGYEHKWKNEKATAYRFENSKKEGFPRIIEFFVEEGQYQESLDKRLAKLDIKVNEERISAIVIDSELYQFALNNRIEIDGLMFLNREALIVLKVIAYFNNKNLYQKNHLVSSNDYLKHRKDVIDLLSSYTSNANPVRLSDSLLSYIIKFEKVLNSNESKQICKTRAYNHKDIIERYRELFLK